LLFFLSLIPVATEWLRNDFEPKPAAFFGLVSFCAAVAYSTLVRTIIQANGRDSKVGRAAHGDVKGLVSIALYGAGVVIAILSAPIHAPDLGTWIPIALYVAVAVMWLVPDQRFTHDHPLDAAG
jgi:uncharacterized membrane protein